MTAQPTGSVLTEGFTMEKDYFGIAPHKHMNRLIRVVGWQRKIWMQTRQTTLKGKPEATFS